MLSGSVFRLLLFWFARLVGVEDFPRTVFLSAMHIRLVFRSAVCPLCIGLGLVELGGHVCPGCCILLWLLDLGGSLPWRDCCW